MINNLKSIEGLAKQALEEAEALTKEAEALRVKNSVLGRAAHCALKTLKDIKDSQPNKDLLEACVLTSTQLQLALEGQRLRTGSIKVTNNKEEVGNSKVVVFSLGSHTMYTDTIVVKCQKGDVIDLSIMSHGLEGASVDNVSLHAIPVEYIDHDVNSLRDTTEHVDLETYLKRVATVTVDRGGLYNVVYGVTCVPPAKID